MAGAIHRLQPELAQLIKSGVLITDIAEGVREVVQNSIDAEARNITVSIAMNQQDIGFRVVDDGNGIAPDQLALVGKRNYTSKVREFNDLKNVNTFGFRGDALNSIASIADIMITSKVADYNGAFRMVAVNSKFHAVKMAEDTVSFGEIRSNTGTIVQVSRMFENMPVRKRFLGNSLDPKFLEHLRLVLFHCCVTNPKVSIKVSLNDGLAGQRLVCNVKSQGSDSTFPDHVPTVFNSIYGIHLKGFSNYLQMSYKSYKIECVVGTLPVQTKFHQYLYYNGRVLNDEKLSQSISQVFNSSDFGEAEAHLLVSSTTKFNTSSRKGTIPVKAATSTGTPYRTYPSFVVKVSGPSSLSDLVQSSSKTIIDFKHINIVEPLILRLMRQFLKSHHYHTNSRQISSLKEDNKKSGGQGDNADRKLMFALSTNKLRFGRTDTRELVGMVNTENQSEGSTGANQNRNPSIENRILKRRRFSSMDHDDCAHTHDSYKSLTPEVLLDQSISRETLSNSKVVSQVGTKFILLKSGTTLYIIDQHACDERVKLEHNLSELVKQVNNPFYDIGVALKNQVFSFSVPSSELEYFDTYKEQCFKWGIRYKIDSDINQVVITHLPELMMKKIDDSGSFLKKCILQYLYDLHNKVKLKEIAKDWWLAVQSIPTILIELMNSKACREAIMFGDELTKEECESLIRDLNYCKSPFYCAHGRPSIVPLYNFAEQVSSNDINDI